MKKSLLYFFSTVWVLWSSTYTLHAQVQGCTTTNPVSPQYPASTYTPKCNGVAETIHHNCFTGEFSKVNITEGQTYTFSSSISTDYVTVTNEDGSVIYAAGPTPLVWTASKSEVIRFYLHVDSACTFLPGSRSRIIQCGNVVPPPANDNCESVTPVTLINGTPVSFTGTTIGGTASTTESSILGYPAVWHAVTLTGSCNNLTLDYCGTPMENMLNNFVLISKNCPITGSIISGTADYTICENTNATIKFLKLPAGTYYLPVLVDHNSNVLGEYTLNVLSEDCPPIPVNDLCENAIALESGDTDTGDTSNATDNGGSSSGDVFYKYTGKGKPELVTVSLCNSEFDTYLRIWKDCSLTTLIARNNDFCGTRSELTFYSDGTSTYIISVEGFASNAGKYEINLTSQEITEPQTGCNWLVKVQDSGYGDEISWKLNDSNGTPLLFGGPYPKGYEDTQYISTQGPLSFSIETEGDMNDNTATFSITTGSTTIATDFINGGDNISLTNLQCSNLAVSDLGNNSFAYYPNPVKDILNISSKTEIASVSVFNMVGQTIEQKMDINQNGQINIRHLTAGNYVIKVSFKDGASKSFKITKK